MSNNTLYLVDGSSYLYRAFFVPNLKRLQSQSGHPTGVMYGVSNMLQRMLDEYQPEYMAVVFDAKGKTFRHQMYPDYKANRPPMPDELRMQLEPTKAIIKAMGIPMLEIAEVEADDVIGTLAKQAEQLNIKTLISTGDKDLAQLVSEQISLVNTMTNVLMDQQAVVDKFGVRPEQIIDYLALVGDSSDNVPGVSKVGPKTAGKWLQQYQSVEQIIANAEQIKGKVGENLRAGIDQLKLSQQLVTIKQDCAVNYQIGDFAIRPRDLKSLKQLGEQYDMRRFAELSEATEATAETTKPQYDCITETKLFKQWLQRIAQSEQVAFDLETDSLNPMQAQIVGLSFATEKGKAAYVPLAHNCEQAQLSLDEVLPPLLKLLEHKAVIGQHFKYDLNVLSHCAVASDYDLSECLSYDTMLESYVLNASASRHDMDSLADFYLQYKTIKYQEVCGKGAKQIPFADVPLADATAYAAEDADITLQLHQHLWPRLSQQPQAEVFSNLEMPLVKVLAAMEQCGVLVDAKALQQQSEQLAEQLQDLERQAHELAGEAFNLASPKQLQTILFEQQGLPVIKKTPSGQASTAEDVLQTLAADYPLPEIILQHRSLNKLKNTYTDKLPQQINPQTGRIHTSYHQAMAITGRLSSNDPNLQNIPIRTAAGRQVRAAFIAPQGWQIMAADYSQIELRIMAHLSQDDNLLAAFQNDLDVHSQTAAQVFDTPLEQVSREQRRAAKAINFGLMYGMSAFGLSKQLQIDRKQAADYIEQYFAQYPKVEQFIKTIKQQAAEQQYLDTLFKRRLYFPEINNRNARIRAASERAAINAPMQGSAADIIKQAMLAVFTATADAPDIRLIMQVHDELVFEVKAEVAEQWATKIKDIMQTVVKLSVPLPVDIGIGDNWQQAH